MTPKERFLNRLKGNPVDKVPNLNIVMLFAAHYAGIPYGRFSADYRALVEAQEKTAYDFGLDILSTMSDAYRETYDYGAKVRFVEDNLPVCDEPLLRGPEDMVKLKRFDPMTSTRMLDRIRAVELYKANNGEAYPILGWVEGPLAEFCDLTTVTEGMIMLYEEPEMVEDALELITEQAIACAMPQIDAGADVIGIGDAVASLVSPTCYRTLIQPREKRIIDAVHARGARVKLHICGNISHLLADMIETGADIVDVDYMVDFDRAIELGRGRCSISGHFNPVEVLYNGTPEDVKKWVRFTIEHGDGRNFVSAGCEVPKFTPTENLRAVDEALREMKT